MSAVSARISKEGEHHSALMVVMEFQGGLVNGSRS